MSAFLRQMDQWHGMEMFFAASVLLILIDYYFTVDYPAYLAYFCCAAGVFLAIPWELPVRLAVFAAVLVVLLVLHRVWFTRFLTNAHEGREETA